MRLPTTKAAIAVTAIAAFGLPAAGAQARNGADDGPAHVRHTGADDGARAKSASTSRTTRRSRSRSRRHARHTGLHRGVERRHGADDGPNHS